MALVKSTFYTALAKTLEDAMLKRHKATNEEESPEAAIKTVAQELAKAITDAVDTYIRSGDVLGGTVATTGTAAAQTGSITVGAKMK